MTEIKKNPIHEDKIKDEKAAELTDEELEQVCGGVSTSCPKGRGIAVTLKVIEGGAYLCKSYDSNNSICQGCSYRPNEDSIPLSTLFIR